MLPKLLMRGDTIGIISPSHVAEPDSYNVFREGLRSLGFNVKFSQNLFKSSYGYSASEKERADDFNAMFADKDVSIVFFGGGEGSNELLPLIDFDIIKSNPKLMLSYSDGTTLLDTVYAKTGLVTFYGQSPDVITGEEVRDYNLKHFLSNICEGHPDSFVYADKWYTLNSGTAKGTLIGGYILNFMRMVNDEQYGFNLDKEYLLFLEEHEMFQGIPNLSASLAHIGQSKFMDRVTGLVFGHYSNTIHPELMDLLSRFGKQHGIPVVYCDDFGHGDNKGILPIGANAILDADKQTLNFDYKNI